MEIEPHPNVLLAKEKERICSPFRRGTLRRALFPLCGADGEAPSCSKVCLSLKCRLSDLLPSLGLALILLGQGCRPADMYDQPKGKPLGGSSFFEDGSEARLPVEHTIPRGHLREDEWFFEGLVDGKLVKSFPVEVTEDFIRRGRERYDIYCAVCHGATGEGNGMIVQRGFPAPPSFHVERLREAPAGHFYHVITHGYGVMYSYADRVVPMDRWAIAAYIQALQLSRSGSLDQVPLPQRNQLLEAHP
jgi:cytochrome c553